MNDHESPPGGSSRRELLLASAVAAAGGGAAAALASCGGGGGSKRKRVETVSPSQAEGDAALLNVLLDLEHGAIAAYATASRRLRGEALAAARTFAAHERRHVTALEVMIHSLGGTPITPRPRSEYEHTFPRLRGARDALSLALDIETTAVAAYADALGKIATDSVRATAGAILVTESEHAAVVLGELGRPQVPQAFVTGPPPEQDGSG
jgi:rubrerythrin